MGNESGKLEEYSDTIDQIERNARDTLQQVEEIRQLRQEFFVAGGGSLTDQHRQELEQKVQIKQNATLTSVKQKFAFLDQYIPSQHKATFDSGVEVLANIIKSKSISGNISPKDLGFNMPSKESSHIHQLIKQNKVQVVQQKINRTNGVIKVLLKLKNLTGKPLLAKILPGDTWVAPGVKIQPGVNATTKRINLSSYGITEKIVTCYCGNSSVSYPSSNPTIVKLCNLQWNMPSLNDLKIFNFTADEMSELKKYSQIQTKIWNKMQSLIDVATKIDDEISTW